MDKFVLGRRIQNAREYRKLTRTELANKIGTVYRDIIRWEKGERKPSDLVLHKIADALDMDMLYFLVDEVNVGYLAEYSKLEDNLWNDLSVDKKKNDIYFHILHMNDPAHLKIMAGFLIDAIDPDRLNRIELIMNEYVRYCQGKSSIDWDQKIHVDTNDLDPQRPVIDKIITEIENLKSDSSESDNSADEKE